MNKKIFLPILMILNLIFSSCLSRQDRRPAIIPIPDVEFFDFTLPIKMENIVATRGGTGARIMPEWLSAYINGGIEAVERMENFNRKYMFVGRSEGQNFAAMSKWAENFSPVRDTIMLVARRIENKIVSSASLYPDYEYGTFFEMIIINAYSRAYPEAVKEDTYWIKMRVDSEEGHTELYVFFVLVSIDREVLQDVVKRMIASSIPSSLQANQRSAVDRLQKNFFEGF